MSKQDLEYVTIKADESLLLAFQNGIADFAANHPSRACDYSGDERQAYEQGREKGKADRDRKHMMKCIGDPTGRYLP